MADILSDLLIHLKCNEAPGAPTAVNEITPGTFDGTLVGTGIDFVSDGVFGNGLYREDSGDYLSLGNNTIVWELQTWAMWIKLSTTTTHYPFATGNGTIGGATFFLNPGSDKFGVYVGAVFKGQLDTVPLDDGEWHHIAVTFIPSTGVSGAFGFYVDFSHIGDLGVAGVTWTAGVDIRIFERVGASNAVDEGIDDVRIYKGRALALEDIEALENPYLSSAISRSGSPALNFSMDLSL